MEIKVTEREVKKIIIHTSDSSFGNAALIDHWHRSKKPKGWDKIGYHKVILNGRLQNPIDYEMSLDGLLETGRADNEQGAHTLGQNADSVAICLIGNAFSHTPAQIKQLVATIRHYRAKYEGANVYFHSEFNKNKKNCPGISAVDLLEIFAGG